MDGMPTDDPIFLPTNDGRPKTNTVFGTMPTANQSSTRNSTRYSTRQSTRHCPEIQWKGNSYNIAEPPRVTFDEFIKNIYEKTRIAEAQEELEAIILEWASELYKHGDNLQWNPVSLKSSDTAALYIVKYLNSGGLKFGMSFRTWLRVKEQDTEENPIEFGAKIMEAMELKDIVPQHHVNKIVALSLPGLSFHTDHKEHLHTLIRLQLMELFLACFYKCVTKTVGERLTQLPSPQVRDITSKTLTKLPHGAVEFLTGIGDGDVVFVFTWPTLRSRLHEMADGNELDTDDRLLLQSVLRPQPPMGQFVKANRIIELFGPKFGWWEDCVKYCPRETQVNE